MCEHVRFLLRQSHISTSGNYMIFENYRSSTDLVDALKHLEIFSAMFSAGRLLSAVRTKLGHPAVFAFEETANVMVCCASCIYV